MTPLQRAVLDLVDRIPAGRVLSYADVADGVGMGSARVVGAVLARYGVEVPWHRVVRADGSCAPGVAAEQHSLLRAEGVPLGPDGRVRMAVARWDGGRGPAPDPPGPRLI